MATQPVKRAPTNNRITQDDKGKQGVSWGVDGAVLATSAVIGSDSSPTPQGASSFVQGAGSRSLPGAAEGGGGGTDSYLDPIAKRSANLDTLLTKQCPGYWLLGSCENGHRYAKELYCGREWCPVCGEEWSAAHQRRFARWLLKATQVKSLGYFIFTIPEALRAKYRTKKALTDLGHQVQELLKGYGYSRGLRRWHWFGDITRSGLRGDIPFHPHLNCLVDGHYISDSKLDAIKRDYAILLATDVVDVWYNYYRSPGQKVHKLKYATRSTFLDFEWDLQMAQRLRGFRNQLWWGSKLWNESPSWSLDDLEGSPEDIGELDPRAVESLESGVCPKCRQPISWSKPILIAILEVVEKRSLGAGYWELERVRPPPGDLPAEVRQKLYLLGLLHRVEVQVAQERAEAEAKVEAEDYQSWWADLVN